MKVQVLIIGAGASGLTAAIYAARAGCQVHILEALERPAKKILATGNGKCNFSNTRMGPDCYRSASIKQVEEVLSRYPAHAAVAFMKEIGIWPRDREGYLYPASGQAASVAECLLMEARRLSVVIHNDSPASKIIRSNKGGFETETCHGDRYGCDLLVLAAGSAAGVRPREWKEGMGLGLSLGLREQHPVPALTALRAEDASGKSSRYRLWAGVRTEAKVTLFVNGDEQAADTGEVQLTDYGISGIPVFQVSRFASYGLLCRKKVEAVLDFMPSLSKSELEKELRRRSTWRERCAREQVCGLWNAKLAEVLCRACRIPLNQPLREKDCGILADTAKFFTVPVEAVNPMEQSQVCAGGVDLREVDCSTMESISIPGLYLVGELLDADGICGGYNLHWAWATGTLAGTAIGRRIKGIQT